jgi:ferredoxin
MFFTGAMKNLFGLIPSVAKSPYHVKYSSREAFASMLVDLNLLEKPTYAFMDAIIGMEGAGPASGSPRQLGLVLASSNILAIDAAACSVIGYPMEKIPVNQDALGRQFWLKAFSEIEYPLLKPEEVRVRDFVKIPFKKSNNQLLDFLIPKPLRKLRKLNSQPRFNHGICIRCGDCTRICASGALYFSGQGSAKQVEINSNACISCYCCHEICPVKAIEV